VRVYLDIEDRQGEPRPERVPDDATPVVNPPVPDPGDVTATSETVHPPVPAPALPDGATPTGQTVAAGGSPSPPGMKTLTFTGAIVILQAEPAPGDAIGSGPPDDQTEKLMLAADLAADGVGVVLS
jgi:hypothetical protein